MTPDDAVLFLSRPSTAAAVAAAYAVLGLLFMARGADMPQWYPVLTAFFAAKIVVDYQKCTLSYLECKLRGVKRERGVLNAALGSVVSLRRLPGGRAAAALFAAAVLWYYFLVRGQTLCL